MKFVNVLALIGFLISSVAFADGSVQFLGDQTKGGLAKLPAIVCGHVHGSTVQMANAANSLSREIKKLKEELELDINDIVVSAPTAAMAGFNSLEASLCVTISRK